jgi:hypothetical protein
MAQAAADATGPRIQPGRRPANTLTRWRQAAIVLLVHALGLLAVPAAGAEAAAETAAPAAGVADAADARRLSAMHATLAPRLAESVFQRPLLMESSERGDLARGDVFAVVPHPFATVAQALQRPAQWCQVLELHLNVKRCAAGPGTVMLHLGTKREQALDQAHPLEMLFTLDAQGPDLLKVALRAAQGPLGTRDYEILLEAVPAGPGSTFMHFGYQVGTSTLARLAMQGYLMTVGRDKLGFSADPRDGRPGTIRGPRAAVERNAMRYQLAIEAYLDTLGLQEPARTERRLAAWFDATERHARQLHEVDRDAYLAMKRRELHSGIRPRSP